jgi:transcriptional adapter 3
MSQPPQSPRETNGNGNGNTKDEPGSPGSDTNPHQPPPAPAVQQYQIFGEDPTAYPDDTIYEIREVTPDMTEDERKEIYSVAHYPASDLHDQTCGTPPDRDFSNAKPAQQVNFTTFQNYAEPFIRPLTEEDRGFLLERGNRENPFVIPKLGAKHYKEIWAEEDNQQAMDPNAHKLAANEARGSIEDMDDEIGATDMVSVGPTLARLMTSMRSEFAFRGAGKEDEVLLPGIDIMDIDGEAGPAANGASNSETKPEPPASQFSEQYWKGVEIPRQDYNAIDERLHRELVYMGLVSPTDTPEYHARLDDEVSARLRYLQTELRRVSIKNGARKARLEELLEDFMSKQEYSTIADDLDNQINAAYLKRNRNIGKKGKQQKRPGGAGGGSHVVGVARTAGGVGVGEPIKGLVERKQRWREWIGAVVENGQTRIPQESVFGQDVMKRFEAQELDRFGEEQEA